MSVKVVRSKLKEDADAQRAREAEEMRLKHEREDAAAKKRAIEYSEENGTELTRDSKGNVVVE